jgi:hypothetical protein
MKRGCDLKADICEKGRQGPMSFGQEAGFTRQVSPRNQPRAKRTECFH